MNPVVINLLACLAAYLLGSVSFAVLSARIFKMADPRTYGSGNPGATNVLRTGNKKAAIFTLMGDTLKGVFAVLLARALGLSDLGIALVALAVFSGHIYPIFLKFKGGKGVATAGGVLLALAPPVGASALATWIAVVFTTRYSSLAAIMAGISAPLWGVIFYGIGEDAAIAFFLGLTLVIKHRVNIQRLIAGTETKVGGGKQA
ncbi:glycerol-3-phosphate acyltransferase [Betaproteobacteria bacterium]|nr:glycerol-3-phosphate acyltransferase [Betaproteobacteria bacterium]GHU11527.1 glycerol-3-phosphate acyltransferase [Betaproteobacteria bacterium]